MDDADGFLAQEASAGGSNGYADANADAESVKPQPKTPGSLSKLLSPTAWLLDINHAWTQIEHWTGFAPDLDKPRKFMSGGSKTAAAKQDQKSSSKEYLWAPGEPLPAELEEMLQKVGVV